MAVHGVRTLAEALGLRPIGGRWAGRSAGYDAGVADGAGGSQPLNDALAMIAPGTKLREGLDRILQAKHGALILVGDGPAVLSVCTGGFLLDAEYSPQRLSELAKMDGAIILASDASRIARANVHLVPKATIATSETGTRHRTAERVARSIDVPVIAVSEAMATIAVYRNERKHTTQSAGWLIDRSSQALSTLQRFRVPLRRRPVHADPPRDGGLGLGARRRLRAAAGRDGPPHRRGDRGPPGRARAPTAGSSTCRPRSCAPASPRAWRWSCATTPTRPASPTCARSRPTR